MRALRVVGITEDNGALSVVLEEPGRQERFVVPADEQLRAAARGDLTRLGQIAIELESQLRPREIQARIRAGASVEQVATAAGVPIAKIERFAYPVLLERSRTAEVAQRAHPMRAEGADSRMLGDVVAHTFGLRGLDYSDTEWDSWKGEDGRWVVALSWRAGRSDNTAHWTFQPGAHGGTVTALDEHASDLVEGLPQRPLRTVGPVIDMARPEADTPAADPEEQRVAARRTADGAGAPAARSAAPERPAAPPAQRQAEPIESAPPARPAARPTPPPVPEPEPEPEPEPVAVEPEPEPVAEEPAPPKRTKKGKPVMPSWDEVLLGVRGQR
ncbi:septation protein SepH [Pseudonocardia sp. CA-107938]|uniref:septation protein SepH n=1 Tax=Pseudonocardia sp. CA-107938 TaxID=3240021 RepID=UPI003D8D5A11